MKTSGYLLTTQLYQETEISPSLALVATVRDKRTEVLIFKMAALWNPQMGRSPSQALAALARIKTPGYLLIHTTVFGNGDITLTGTGGNGTGQDNRGVIFKWQQGGIHRWGGRHHRHWWHRHWEPGIFVDNTTVLGNGDITLTAGGNGTGQFNAGVALFGSRVESTGGAIAITGTAARARMGTLGYLSNA